jgi:BMFP domain-containing protein YqiC
MQTRNPFFDEFGKAIENVMGVAQAAGEEAKAVMRAQADRMAVELDLVRRDEFEAMRASLEGQIEALRQQLAQSNASPLKARAPDDGG